MTEKNGIAKLSHKTVIVTTSGVTEAIRLEEVFLQCGLSVIASSPRTADTDAAYVGNGERFFWFNNKYNSFAEHEHITVTQFLGLVDESLLYSAGEKALQRRFNELSERVDRLTALVEKIADEIVPKGGIDKPGLK